MITIRDFADMFINPTVIEIYSNDDEMVLGAWWTDEIPPIFDEFTIDSMDGIPTERKYTDVPVITVNSDDCSIETLSNESWLYDYEYEHGELDMTGFYEKYSYEIFS